MDRDEMKTFINVWASAVALLCYCYSVAASVPKGTLRLISLLPVSYLLTILPLSFSSFQLVAPAAFLLVWLCNFKLLLFSFNAGPLAHSPSCLHFILVAALPIKIKQDTPPVEPRCLEARSLDPTREHIQTTHQPLADKNQAVTTRFGTASDRRCPEKSGPLHNRHEMAALPAKLLLLALLHHACDYRSDLPHYLVWVLYGTCVFFGIQIVLAIYAIPGWVILAGLGHEIEAQFKDPLRTTSLEDFWGRRWNLTVSRILREAIYNPFRSVCIKVVGPDMGSYAAVFATFAVSGLMHEAVFYYFMRMPPTWEVIEFFLIQGGCVVIEKVVKKRFRKTWQPNKVVAGVLTLGFLGVTAIQLIGIPLMKNGIDEKAIKECHVIANFSTSWIRSHSPAGCSEYSARLLHCRK